MRQRGQNIGEYGLALGLIVVVCISVLSLFGTNLQDLFSNSIKHKSPLPSVDIAGTAGESGVSFQNTSATAKNPFPTLPGKLVQVDLGNGKTLTLNMADPVAVAEAAGGNGVTENALAAIEQIIAQLREQGEDEAQIAELEKLALAGQKIKAVQQQIEAKYPPSGQFESQSEKFAFLTDPANNIVVNGEEMTLMKASQQLSTNTGTFSGISSSGVYSQSYSDSASAYANRSYYEYTNTIDRDPDKFSMAPGLLHQFMRQLQAVETSGLLNTPALKNLIKDQLSKQIFSASNQTFQAPSKTDFANLVRITRTSSNDICTMANSATCQDRSS